MYTRCVVVIVLIILIRINQLNGLQCYKCGCSIAPGETICTNISELACTVEHVESSYCFIERFSNYIKFDHRSNVDLMVLESLHYIQTRENISFSENTGLWHISNIVEFIYGCDWSLCNTPRVLSFLPKSLMYSIDSSLLTSLFIKEPTESFTTCFVCTGCLNSSDEIVCPTLNCGGTCFMNGYSKESIVDFNLCPFIFESQCNENNLNATVQVTGIYYIDNDLYDINDINVWCKKNNCNHPKFARILEKNLTFSIQIDDQLYFRPSHNITTPPTQTNGTLACFICQCEHPLGNDDCKLLQCTVEQQNGSYCEIVRSFKNSTGMETIRLGHVQRQNVPFDHFIHVEEEMILFRNLSWHPTKLNLITYVCDWPLCNDARIVEKLTTSFQFDAEPSVIAGYLHSSEPLTSCRQCTLCTNASLDFDACPLEACTFSGHCFIEQYIDDTNYNHCEYAFQAACKESTSESSIAITATYSIDDDILDFNKVNVHCSKNDCNRPETILRLLDLIQEDIQLDPLFFIRPIMNTTSTSTVSVLTTQNSCPALLKLSHFCLLLIFHIVHL